MRVKKEFETQVNRDDAKDKLVAAVAKEDVGALAGPIQLIARAKVADGIRELKPLVLAVQEEVQEVIPDISEREIRDIISGYGKVAQLSKDEISVALRELKSQAQKVSQLEDVLKGQPPKKTGLQREKQSQKVRELTKEVNAAMKKAGIQVTDPATQLKSSMDAVKTRLRNSIEDLTKAIDDKKRLVAKTKSLVPDPEVKKLKAERDRLKNIHDTMFPKKLVTPAQRLEIAIRASRLSKEYWAGRLARARKGDFGAPTKAVQNLPKSQQLDDIRKQRDAAKEEHQRLKDIAHPKLTPEQRALRSFKTRIRKNMEELRRKLRTKDFTKKVRKELKLDDEALDLKMAHEKVKVEWNRGLFMDRLRNRSIPKKILGGAREVLNTTRAVVTSIDLSAVARQGAFIGLAHPVRASRAIPAMLRSLTKKGHFRTITEIQNRPNAALYKASGLFIAEPNETSLAKMEEAYMSRWAERIPGVAASARAYTSFLNQLRADSFDAMVASLSRDGKVTLKEAKAIANFINVSTGRGNLSILQPAAVALNTAFFSPRYTVSRFQLLLGQPFYHGTKRTKILVAKEYGRFMVGASVMYALAYAADAAFGDDDDIPLVEWNPRSSDFGKIRIRKTRIDPMAGMVQTFVFMTRLITGETKSTRTGRVTPIRGKGVPFRGDTSFDIGVTFFRNKLSPVFATAARFFDRTDKGFKRFDVLEEGLSLTTPLALRDVIEVVQEHGIILSTAIILAAIFGVGVQVYDK